MSEILDAETGLTTDEFMSMTGKNIECGECGKTSFRVKQGVDRNKCRHCPNVFEDAW